MKLQGRHLTNGTRGDDVRLLHKELRLLGYRSIREDTEVRPGIFGPHTYAVVREFQEKHGLPVTGVVDEKTAAAINRELDGQGGGTDEDSTVYSVRGVVQSTDREPLPGVLMSAYDQSLQGDRPLGDARTGPDGSYEIRYPRASLRRPDQGADLLVRAASPAHGTVSAPVVLGAGPEETVDFALGDGPLRAPAVFERLTRDVEPVLSDEGMTMRDVARLDYGRMALLAARSGASPRDLTLLRGSQQLTEEVPELESDVLFGLGQQKVPLDLPSLLAQDPAHRREAARLALESGQIPGRKGGEVDRTLERLQEISIREALKPTPPGGATTLGALLGTARLPADRQEALAGRYARHQGTMEDFWRGVRDDGVLSPAEVSRTQLTLQLGAVTLNHAPLVAQLLEEGIGTPRDLARLDRADWLAKIRRHDVGLPAELTASRVGEEDYADLMYRMVEDAFPTAVVANRVQQLPDSAPLQRFFGHNPDFEMRSTPLAVYLRQKPDALSGLSDDEKKTVVHRLKGVERTWHVAPPGQRMETISLLVTEGVDSAQKIRGLGRAAFERRFAARLAPDGTPEGLETGRRTARAIFNRADTTVAVAETLLARHAAGFHGTQMEVLPRRPANLDALPDYKTLFGSLDFCSCGECQSVYSPAAYMVDLLYWLHNRPKTAGKSPLDVLFDHRRGDLGGIELSCKNTNTPLPTLDLANEAMELLVEPPVAAVSYQTRGSAADLLAHPEHLHGPAYEVLAGGRAAMGRDAVFPFNLPFDLWLEEARTYLGHLGVPRHRLMAAFHAVGAAAARTDPAVAFEALGMSPLEGRIVAGEALVPARQTRDFWGLAGDASWLVKLVKVSFLLDRLAPPLEEHGRGFDDLAGLLRARFLQGAAPPPADPVEVWFNVATCDTTRAELTGLTEAFLARCHRFVRLRRRLGWSVADLDRAVEVLGAGTLDQTLLGRLALVQALAADLSVPVAEMLSWWGPLDTRRWKGRLVPGRPASIPGGPAGRAGFGFVYRDAGLTPQPAEADDQSFYDLLFQPKSVSAAPDPAFGVNPAGTALVDETLALAAHLPAVAAALAVTAQDLARLLPRLPNDRLSLANLSALHRHVSLARALELTVPGLVSLLDLTRIDPFDPAHPEDTVRLVEEARAIRDSGVSLDELDYLLRHRDTSPSAFAPDDKAVGVVLRELRDALRKAEADGTPLDGAAIQKLAEAFGLPPAVMAPLLRTHLHHPAGGPRMLDVFVDRAVIDFEPAAGADPLPRPADLPAAFAAWRRLHKVALVLQRFRATLEEIPWLFEYGPARGTLDFDDLPSSEPLPAAIPYEAWARLRDAVALRDRAAGGRLFDLFAAAAGDPAATREKLLTELAQRTRWSLDDLTFLAGAGGFNLAWPAGFSDERGVLRLAGALTAVRRVGLSAALLLAWRTIPADLAGRAAQAQEIKQAVRARQSGPGWSAVARPLRDRLRELQRDALAAWLVAHDGRFADVHGLFGHLLIDVEMSPCQLTSRIKQALSSIQLFIGRAFLNLEPAVRFEPDDAREWKWRKSYRVWEANRKVFLYPENWIEPELRDDKSPFFRELEDQLLQSEVTDDAAEKAVRGYLERLDAVARLEVVGLYHQKDDDTDLLHVLARTRGTPARWFYRRRVDSSFWTPWEDVNLEIEGDHVLPVVYNRRLHVFWAQITEAALEAVPDTPADGGDNTAERPERYYQIRLAWSEHRDGKWAAKRLSPDRVGNTPDDYRRLTCALRKSDTSTPDDFLFRVFEDSANGDLLVEPVRCVRGKSKDKKEGTTYYRIDRFRLSGCDGTLTLERNPATDHPLVRRPALTETEAQAFTRSYAAAPLSLPARNPSTGAYESTVTLGTTLSPFAIVPPNQDTDFLSQSPFFFQDRRKTWFVEPYDAYWEWELSRRPPVWVTPDRIPLDPRVVIPEIRVKPPLPPWPDPWIEDPSSRVTQPNPVDVVVQPPVFPVEEPIPGGVLGRQAKSLAAPFGARVGFIGGAPVAPGARKIAVQSTAAYRVVDRSTGGPGGPGVAMAAAPRQNLLTVQPPASPAAAQRLHVLTMDSQFEFYDAGAISYVPSPVIRLWDGKRFRFFAFDHPFVCEMRRQLNRLGLDGLLDPPATGSLADLRRQRRMRDTFGPYLPTPAVATPRPRDEFDFSFGGAYSVYNWELFFHVPFTVAVHLSRNQRFEEAMRWFHFIFDPTESSSEPAPQRFWKLGPFFDLFHGEDVEAGPIYELLLLLHDTSGDPDKVRARENLLAQIREWRKKPFNPHAIARLRLTAYQKAVVMRYIDNLIEWGDQLFRRDTIESINEATQLYILAAQLLGRRPRRVEVDPPAPRTFNQLLAAGLDELGNALVEEVEGYLPPVEPYGDDPEEHEEDVPVLGPTLYFCVPPNGLLITRYWDRVADRLFKIRHCMNIEGVVRQLPLFEPPIDPALLVRAAAAGIDLGSALADLAAPLPLQRFQVLLPKVLELTGDVRALGSALLSALEKKDAEALALLRAGHEIKLQTAMLDVRRNQIKEAEATLENLQRSRENANLRLQYYRSRQFMNAQELRHVQKLQEGRTWESRAQAADLTGAILGALPNFDIGICGFGGSPIVKASWGSPQLIQIAKAIGDGFRMAAATANHEGQMASILAGHLRRFDDWGLQGDIAAKEIEGLDKQILAAQIRQAIAERELANLELQIANSQEAETFLRDKYTNVQLYQWMVGQLSSLYFQSYQLAYDLAKRAEKAFRHELPLTTDSFIQFGYWDGLKKGLLAGERLHYDLRRLETAYLDRNRREYELTRHVSLRQLDPEALVELRRSGECVVRIPEAWYDLDTPGHYLRRIKSVALSLPSVAGPYVPVRCTLTLLSSSVRIDPASAAPYRRTGPGDARFRDDALGVQSIVTSRAQEDSGLFETNLRDERYLPFEGAGAISEWRLQLPKKVRHFDYGTISDAVLHVRYTARDGGDPLRQAAENEINAALQNLVLASQEAGAAAGLFHLISLRQDFPQEWHRFLNPPPAQADSSLALALDKALLPYALQGATVKILSADLFLVIRDPVAYRGGANVRLGLAAPGGGDGAAVELVSSAAAGDPFAGLPHGSQDHAAAPKDPGVWTIRFVEADNAGAAVPAVILADGHRRLNPAEVEDLLVAVRLRVTL